METWKYLKFVFTRWYFWLVYLGFVYFQGSELKVTDPVYSLTGMFLWIVWGAIIPTEEWFRKKKQP